MLPTVLGRSNMAATSTSAPFSRAVVKAMQKLYPKALADNSWDNTGLLLEAPFVASRRQSNTVLLTIDLTKAVADEAIDINSSIVVAYHPIIFKGLKSLTFANTQQQTLLRLASHGISVYSPHTAVDSAPGGLGDWLADIVTGASINVEEDEPKHDTKPPQLKRSDSGEDPFTEKKRPTYTLSHHPSQTLLEFTRKRSPTSVTAPHTRRPIAPQSPELSTHPGAGMGRLVQFKEEQPLTTVLDRVGRGLNNPKGFPIAIPQGKTISDINIRSVGICAGSGASLLNNIDADLLFTGEMSHHDALAAIEKGQVVISLFHSNSERGYLQAVMKGQLEETIQAEWAKIREGEKGDKKFADALEEEEFKIAVSEVDRDPYGIVVLKTDMK